MRTTLPLICLFLLLAVAPAAEATTRVAVYCDTGAAPSRCGASIRDTDTDCTPGPVIGFCQKSGAETLVGIVIYTAPDPCMDPDCYGGVGGGGSGADCTAVEAFGRLEKPGSDIDLGIDLWIFPEYIHCED